MARNVSQTRRLAAILAADVAGYSRLIGRMPTVAECRSVKPTLPLSLVTFQISAMRNDFFF